jgi:hypothetical protein
MVSSFDLYIGFYMEKMALIFAKLQGKNPNNFFLDFGYYSLNLPTYYIWKSFILNYRLQLIIVCIQE